MLLNTPGVMRWKAHFNLNRTEAEKHEPSPQSSLTRKTCRCCWNTRGHCWLSELIPHWWEPPPPNQHHHDCALCQNRRLCSLCCSCCCMQCPDPFLLFCILHRAQNPKLVCKSPLIWPSPNRPFLLLGCLIHHSIWSRWCCSALTQTDTLSALDWSEVDSALQLF